MKNPVFETRISQSNQRGQLCENQASEPTTVNLARMGLCALRYEEYDKARGFYDRHKPPVYVMDTSGSGDPVSYFVYKHPGVDACLADGIELFCGEMPFDKDDGDLTNAPGLPSNFFRADGNRNCVPESYVQRDWYMVLIPRGSKAPSSKGWNLPESAENPHGYTQNLERIRKHLEQGGNLGLATQPSQVAVLDIDDLDKARDFFAAWDLKEAFDDLLNDASQLHILSGRLGRDKILFKVAQGFSLNTWNRAQTNGFELHFQSQVGTTTQDILPPSIHPDTGQPYQWKGSLDDIQHLPDWLADMWMHRGNVKQCSSNASPEIATVSARQLSNLDGTILAHALERIPSEDYDTWIRVGLALKNSLGEVGYQIWLDWSESTQAGNFCPDACSAKWHRGFNGEVETPITLGSVYHMAEQAGWSKTVFAESRQDYILEVIGRKAQEEITSNDFLDLLRLYKTHAPLAWERHITPSLAKAGQKTRVHNLLKARRMEHPGLATSDLSVDNQEPVLLDLGDELPKIRLMPARIHETLRETLGILAKSGTFFRQGAAICNLLKIPGGVEIFTFTQASELRPELLNHAHWERRTDAGIWYLNAPDVTFANELRAFPDKSVLPELKALSRQPFFRPDMSLCLTAGYDEKTRIYGDFDPEKFNILANPTREDAQAAVTELRRLFEECGLETEYDHSAAMALFLTAAIRPSLSVAPFYLLNAKDPGAGKKYLGDIACYFTSREPPTPLILKKDQNEVAKAVFSILLKGQSSLVFDEVMTDDDGTLDLPKSLLTIATSENYRDRILTTSQTAECSTRAVVILMGNNLRPTQDSARRLIHINFAGRDVAEGVKSYSHDPRAEIQADRERYVGLAFTIIQAWLAAGKPSSTLPKLPTYGDWCLFVREPLLWLGLPDPVHNTLQAIQQDDHALNLRDLYSAWYELHGVKPITAGQLLRGVTHPVEGEDEHPLYAAIKELIPHKSGDDISQRLGYFLKRHVGVIRGGFVLRKEARNDKSNSKVGNRYFVEKVGLADVANADFFGEEML